MKKLIIFTLLSVTLLFSCIKEKKDSPVPNDIEVESVKMDKSELIFTEGGDAQMLIATVLPKEAVDKTITWSSSDETVAMSVEGLVTVFKAGECVITASSANKKTAQCKIIVNKGAVNVTSILIEYDEYTGKVGEDLNIKATVFPENADDKSYTIKVEDETVLKQKTGQEGNIFTVLSAGTSKVTFTSVMNKDIVSECTVSVVASTHMIDPKDGRKYKTVQIGDQVWMAENYAFLGDDDQYWGLLTTRDADHISSSTAFCYVYQYEGQDIEEAKKSDHYKEYGAFYNFEAAKTLAPKGWHLPTKADWVALQKFIGMSDEEIDAFGGYDTRGTVAGKLKEKGTWLINWGTNEADYANNQTGFSAKAAGESMITDKYPNVPGWCYETASTNWWADEEDPDYSYRSCRYGLVAFQVFVYRQYDKKSVGHSVRYIKDKE